MPRQVARHGTIDVAPGAMGDCGVGESTTFGALLTRRTPQAGKRSLEAGGNGAVGGEGGEPFPPFLVRPPP